MNTNQSPSRALAAVFHGSGQALELSELQVPDLATGEALVRVECCTLCTSDLHTIQGRRQEPSPSILGHEVVGRVVQLSDPLPRELSGRQVALGDRVSWSNCLSCGTCERCQRGLPQKCASLFKYGHAVSGGRSAMSGGLAEYVLLRAGTAIVLVPEALPDEVACPVNCATATVVAAFRTAGEVRGRSVLVLGAGMLGLTAAAYAQAAGAKRVVVCDRNPERRELASSFGADETLSDSSSIGARFDLVLEFTAAVAVIESALRVAEIGGQVILVGSVMRSPGVCFDPEQVVRRCLTIRGIHNYAPDDLLTAMRFLTDYQHRFPFAKLVEHSWPLSEVNRAIEFAAQHQPIRVAVRP